MRDDHEGAAGTGRINSHNIMIVNRLSNGAGTTAENGLMVTGTLELDLLLGDVHSLKQKRSVLRPIIADLRKQFEVSAAEAGEQDLHRRALVGVAVVAGDQQHCREVLEACERRVADRPEIDVLSARQRFWHSDDE